MKLAIAAESFGSDDAQRLIAALDAELAQLYTPEQRFGLNCGAIRVLDPITAEAKRLYVEPSHRSKGIGKAVLDGLEMAARELGVTRLVLETGIYQEAAIALYGHAGFRPLDCWGEYTTSPTSVCFAKELA